MASTLSGWVRFHASPQLPCSSPASINWVPMAPSPSRGRSFNASRRLFLPVVSIGPFVAQCGANRSLTVAAPMRFPSRDRRGAVAGDRTGYFLTVPQVGRPPVLAGGQRAILAGYQVRQPPYAGAVTRQAKHAQLRFLGTQCARAERFHLAR